MWNLKVVGVIELFLYFPKVIELILGWLSTYMWHPVVAVLDEQGLPREYGELTDTLKTDAEILVVVVHAWIGKDSDAGREWGQEEKGMTEHEMAGWHH